MFAIYGKMFLVYVISQWNRITLPPIVLHILSPEERKSKYYLTEKEAVVKIVFTTASHVYFILA